MKKIGYSTKEDVFCCGILTVGNFCISNNDNRSWTEEEAKRAESMFMETARLAGKGYLIASTIGAQYSVEELLPKAGWQELDTFSNPNTGNNVTVWGFNRNY